MSMATAFIGAGCFVLGFTLGRIREWYAQQASYRYARDVRRELDLFQAMRDAKLAKDALAAWEKDHAK